MILNIASMQIDCSRRSSSSSSSSSSSQLSQMSSSSRSSRSSSRSYQSTSASQPSTVSGGKSNGEIAFVDVIDDNLANRIEELAHIFEDSDLDHQLIVLHKKGSRKYRVAQGQRVNVKGFHRSPIPQTMSQSERTLLCPRIHFYEVDDQSWFPQFLRERVQTCLTTAWTLRVPVIQKSSPAQLVASTLYNVLSSTVTKYIYVDFCAGAGGPTPHIEQFLNAQIRSESQQAGSHDRDEAVKFVLTDIHPHIPDWTRHCKKSENLSFVDKSVDATDAPADIVDKNGKKVFRLFNLAFHHFDDPLAKAILRNTIETSDGFGIFELTERTASSFLTVFAMGVLFMLISPFCYWNDPVHLFFTYIIPIVPAVVVFDGYVSSLRTRTAGEVKELMRSSGVDTSGWKIMSGRETHTWPTGHMTWVVGIKE